MADASQWLKHARRRAGFARQDDLAAEMGVTRGAIGNWESGRGAPSMANAERLAVLLKRPRSEVLAKFGYPIGGGDPMTDLPVQPPVEWLEAMRAEIAAGVADGIALILEQLRAEGLLPAADSPRRRPQQRRTAG